MSKGSMRPPGNVAHLQRLISKRAAEQGMPPARLQRWLSAMVLAGALDRVRDEVGQPVFLLKGGVAMELRLGLRARATRDYDAAVRAGTDEVVERLDEALDGSWNNFELSRDAPEQIGSTEALRIRVRIHYKGRSWGSIQLELAPIERDMAREVERVQAIPLEALRLPTPDSVSCLSLRYQVAQKLHACTEVFESGRENDRFRDVLDILLVEDLLREIGLALVRDACVTVFEARDGHRWPPTVRVYESWRFPFAELARANAFTPEDIDEAAADLTALIEAIDTAE